MKLCPNIAIVAGVLIATAPAMAQPLAPVESAEDSSVERCIDDHVAFQELEQQGHQAQARKAALRCGTATCPPALRRECLAASDRLREALERPPRAEPEPQRTSTREPSTNPDRANSDEADRAARHVDDPSADRITEPSDPSFPPTGKHRETAVGPIVAIAGLGIATAGLVTFGVAGAIALHRRGELATACDASRCAPEHASYLAGARAAGHAATAGAVVAGVGVTVGIIGLVVGPGTPADRPTATVLLGPGLVGVRGRF